ncbi:hypothetical protein Y1Q_0017827 [Alligator mississippiensis]|uniref:Uncharacterized protein n=1 Tax=Alligator mississippiensis TaxID=8496 RepID=A0A151MJM2_ALLMI|nr:hypothetical protein Y1Q_0017827 [Alligator mississippiensis]
MTSFNVGKLVHTNLTGRRPEATDKDMQDNRRSPFCCNPHPPSQLQSTRRTRLRQHSSEGHWNTQASPPQQGYSPRSGLFTYLQANKFSKIIELAVPRKHLR